MWLLWIGLCCVASSVQSPAQVVPKLCEDAAYVLPLKFDRIQHPIPTVEVRINGSEPMPFAVDTGSFWSVTLDNWAATKVGLKNHDKPVTGSSPHVYEADVRTVEIDGMSKGRSVSLVMDTVYVSKLSIPPNLVGGERIAGVIGALALATTTTRLDFVNKTLTLFLQPHAPLTIPGAAKLRMTLLSKDTRYGLEIGSPGGSTEMMLDTGSVESEIPSGLAASLGAESCGTVRSWTPNGELAEQLFLIPKLYIGDLVEPDVLANERPIGAHGLPSLGLNVLSRFRITFDLPNKEVLLERADDYLDRKRLPGVSGVQISQRRDDYVVDAVQARSTAYRAGLRAGDRVVAVDGQQVKGLPGETVQRLVDGLQGKRIEVQIARGSTDTKVSLLIPASLSNMRFRASASGLILQKGPSGELRITDVSPTSAAERAGILVGNEVIEVNGVGAQSISERACDILLSRMKTTPVILRLRSNTGSARTIKLPSSSGSS